MGGFKFEQCGNIEGLYLVEPQVFSDERGYNLEAYHAGSFREAGLDNGICAGQFIHVCEGDAQREAFSKKLSTGKAGLCRERRGV
ncbi:dTDP-4-dehydrorhamnose 3,5-epimerase family protein [Hungatella hathewayi]|uniref:dTDP-4-dehydrorhamnose 3,5-epimerase family protein n=1 Tax=Hungatella hathewayi TaxID=154046 RepID=UPI0003A4D346